MKSPIDNTMNRPTEPELYQVIDDLLTLAIIGMAKVVDNPDFSRQDFKRFSDRIERARTIAIENRIGDRHNRDEWGRVPIVTESIRNKRRMAAADALYDALRPFAEMSEDDFKLPVPAIRMLHKAQMAIHRADQGPLLAGGE